MQGEFTLKATYEDIKPTCKISTGNIEYLYSIAAFQSCSFIFLYILHCVN